MLMMVPGRVKSATNWSPGDLPRPQIVYLYICDLYICVDSVGSRHKWCCKCHMQMQGKDLTQPSPKQFLNFATGQALRLLPLPRRTCRCSCSCSASTTLARLDCRFVILRFKNRLSRSSSTSVLLTLFSSQLILREFLWSIPIDGEDGCWNYVFCNCIQIG